MIHSMVVNKPHTQNLLLSERDAHTATTPNVPVAAYALNRIHVCTTHNRYSVALTHRRYCPVYERDLPNSWLQCPRIKSDETTLHPTRHMGINALSCKPSVLCLEPAGIACSVADALPTVEKEPAY